MKHYPELCV